MRYFLSFLFLLTGFLAKAQGVDALFRSNLKIYVVVAVLLIIFAGIIFMLVGMEKRLRKIEQK